MIKKNFKKIIVLFQGVPVHTLKLGILNLRVCLISHLFTKH